MGFFIIIFKNKEQKAAITFKLILTNNICKNLGCIFQLRLDEKDTADLFCTLQKKSNLCVNVGLSDMVNTEGLSLINGYILHFFIFLKEHS